ncbi:CUB and zona pellucida-like domain-containing protein 1 [Anabas testudineus]|uniref:CUB and zona pellucida-like domain-containing protein 1 n=1 Tax=Anabas testudineus TaxID=64144 RepID=UPI000E45CC32|nr:CUB and zona pellucida-like domain-containing protein 1 [Anabas testudineus]
MDPTCNLSTRSNSTHLVTVMSLNACGTIIEEDDNNIIFKNQITSADTDKKISRNNDVEIAFLCVYPKKTNLTLRFTHKNPYIFTEKNFGTFTFQFEFYESQRFLRQINDSRYPVEVDLKQMMFMQIEAATSVPNVELFVESCWATPYDNRSDQILCATHFLFIIRELVAFLQCFCVVRCVKDNTVRVYPGSKSQFRFGMESFEFIGAQPEVYITCLVILCESGNPGTRCSQGCIPSNYRGKREAAAQPSKAFHFPGTFVPG